MIIFVASEHMLLKWAQRYRGLSDIKGGQSVLARKLYQSEMSLA